MSADALPYAPLVVFAAFIIGVARAMQDATGLLYTTMTFVLADEALADGLLFVKAVAT